MTDGDQADAIKEALNNTASNGYADLDLYVGVSRVCHPSCLSPAYTTTYLPTYLQDFLNANGIEINALDPSVNKAIFIPAYSSSQFNDAFAQQVCM